MRTIVYDVAASSGGALAILKNAYDEAVRDQSNEYVFLLSTPEFRQTKNVSVLNYPWVKKSWLHRIAFDVLVAPRMVKGWKIDKVISLQSTMMPFVRLPQTVYFHNPLPKAFTDERFPFRSPGHLWVYQNVIGPIIERAAKRCDELIVQTVWMKNRCVDKLGIPPDKIQVVPPRSSRRADLSARNDLPPGPLEFFYPATSVLFKNHDALFDACSLLEQDFHGRYKLTVTLDRSGDARSRALAEKCREADLPVDFVGWLSASELEERYARSVLVFPSYLETWGLPLVEAQEYGAPIIAADLEYARETCGDYENVVFVDPHDAGELAYAMRGALLSRRA